MLVVPRYKPSGETKVPTPMRSRMTDSIQRLWPGLAVAAVAYVVAGGRFDARAGRQALSALLITVCLGVPLFWLFRVSIRWLAFWSRAKGYGATAVGITLSFALLITLVHFVPRPIGLGCLPLGLIGGIYGSLEAKDRSLEHRS